MITKIKTLFKIEAVRYLFIGGCTTAVNFIFFALFRNLIGLNLNLSNFLSISAAIIFAFFTNKTVVFSTENNSVNQTAKEFLKFVAGRLVTMLIEIFGVWLLVEFLAFNEYISKFAIQLIVLVSNYIISKFFVFKK